MSRTTSEGDAEDPGSPNSPLDVKVKSRFGVLPNFFRLSSDAPEITANLWGFAEFGYLDNPLPSLFKERLFVYLSRFCDVRYCIARHVGFLVGLGRPAGDRTCDAQTVEQVIQLISRPLPRHDELEPHLILLERGAAPLPGAPLPDAPAEQAVIACATHVFLQTPEAPRCLEALRRAFGEVPFQHLLVFLTFVRTAHYWTKVHPELGFEDDVKYLLATHELLAERVLNDPEAATCETTHVLLDELAMLRRERALRVEIEQLSIALEAGQLGAWQWNIETGALECTAICKAHFGLAPQDELTYTRLFDLIHPADRDRTREVFQRSIEQRIDYEAEYRAVWPRGETHWIVARGRCLYRPDGKPERMIGVIMDVTRRKLSEAALKEADQRKDEFLAMLSHELRSPLNAVTGWLQVLRSKRADPSHAERALDAIHRNTRLLARIVDDLLDISRIVAGRISLELSPVEVSPLVQTVLDTLEPIATEKGVSVESSLDPWGAPVLADPGRLQQIFQNILANAIKFTPAGGRVVVSVQNDGQDVAILFKDTGQGISPEFLPHVFEAFRQADPIASRVHGGLGLGLAIVHHLATLLQGTVIVDSAGIGQGCCVTVRLPRMEGPLLGRSIL